MQTFDIITSYTHGGNTGKVCKTDLLDHLNVLWLILIILLMKKEEQNPKWLHIPDHPYRILIRGASGSRKKCIVKFNKQSTRYW